MVSQLEQERASSAKLKKELEEVWKSDAKAAYQLTSVFIHRGSSPSFGHYFFYARNLPERPDQWFKYNDSTVSVVSKDEVLADTTGSTANPYMVRSRMTGRSRVLSLTQFPTACLRSERRRGHRYRAPIRSYYTRRCLNSLIMFVGLYAGNIFTLHMYHIHIHAFVSSSRYGPS